MKLWRQVWHAFADEIGIDGCRALLVALEADDPRLHQGVTVHPPPLPTNLDCPPESACAVSLCGWLSEPGLISVGEVEEYFARVCHEVDQRLGQSGGCRHFLNWFDETPREEMRAALIPEVRLALGMELRE